MLELVLSEPGGRPDAAAARLVRTWSDDGGTAFARAFVDAPTRWIDWPGIGAFEFTPPSHTVRLHPSTADATRARDTFARIVQPIILQALGAECLHGSAVVSRHEAVALLGTTGNGKSTIAWAMDRTGHYRQIADDAVVLDGFGDALPPVVRPLPFRPRLRQASIDALHNGEPVPTAALDVPADACPLLAAVVVLDQDAAHGPSPTVTPLGASEAFKAVVTHAYAFDEHDPDERERMSTHYLSLVATVPVLRLRYRPDFRQLPQLIETLGAALDDCRSRRV